MRTLLWNLTSEGVLSSLSYSSLKNQVGQVCFNWREKFNAVFRKRCSINQLRIWRKSLFTSIPSLGECRIFHLFDLSANLYPDLFLQWQVKPDNLLVQLRVEYESLGELGRQLRSIALNRLPLPPLAVGSDPISTIDLLIRKSTHHIIFRIVVVV